MGKFLLVVAIFAALVYATFWLLEKRRSRRALPRPGPQAPSVPRRSTAPDDDEEFLRELERRRRRAARERAKKNPREDENKPEKGQSSPE